MEDKKGKTNLSLCLCSCLRRPAFTVTGVVIPMRMRMRMLISNENKASRGYALLSNVKIKQLYIITVKENRHK